MSEEFDWRQSPLAGVNLIEANAGTGKTYTIVRIFLRLLLEKKIPIEKILVVTFTEAATAELKDRVARTLHETLQTLQTHPTHDEFLQTLVAEQGRTAVMESLESTLLKFDEVSISTIHGFCRKILQEFAFETQSFFESELLANQDPLIEELARDYWRNAMHHDSPKYSKVFLQYMESPHDLAQKFKQTLSKPKLDFLPKIDQSPQRLWEESHTDEDKAHNLPHAIVLDFFRWAKPQLQARKMAANQQSFDDWLAGVHHALHGEFGEDLAKIIQKRFSVALIDEFQDTDLLQYKIFQKIFGNRDLFFIGDPKQSIYKFRGADIFAYLQAKKEATHQFTLKTNWRSNPKLVQALNVIFSKLEHPFVNPHIPYLPSQASPSTQDDALLIHQKAVVPLQIWCLETFTKKPDARQIFAESAACEITRLLNLGQQGKALIQQGGSTHPVQPRDIAVLVRTHSEAETTRKLLSQRRVPCVVKTQTLIFQTVEFKEILTLAAALQDTTNPASVRAALLTNLMGYNGTQVFEMIQNETAWEALIQRFYDYHHQWKQEGFYPMMRHFLRNESVSVRVLSEQNGERRLTNILHALEWLHQMESDQHLSPTRLLDRALEAQKSPAEAQEDHLVRLETDAEALTILTVHASKGLEFPIVFCPFSWGNRTIKEVFFHDEQGQLFWDLKKLHKDEAKKETLAEEIRLVYVALTRAKYCCYTAWGNINRTEDSPFKYLFPTKNKNPWEYLEKLAEQSQGTIVAVEALPENDEVFQRKRAFQKAPHCRQFTRSLHPQWGITSFSALSQKVKDWTEGQDHDEHQIQTATPLVAENTPDDSQPLFTVHRLPKGANTGNCFHEILEDLNFQEKDTTTLENLVRDKLRKYHFAPQWQPVALSMIRAACEQKITAGHLNSPAFSLSELPETQVVKEMPFHFPIQRCSAEMLRHLVRQHQTYETHKALLSSLEQLSFHTLKGFMKGYIDLLFCQGGRYYILDWKTNYLGDGLEDYAPPLLRASIEAHFYNLQYVIYAVALHKYLRLRIRNYHFEQHFGGVYYFFLRGLDPASAGNHGIYYDSLKESARLIEQLESVFEGNPVP